MAYGYRRQSNLIGWLTFFAIGGAVFMGLVFALVYFKEHADAEGKKAQAALPQTNHPTLGRKASDVVKEQLTKIYEKEGKPLDARYGEPLEVMSQKAKHNVVIIEVQHRESGSDKDYTSEVFVLDRTKIARLKSEDWPTRKADFGIAEDPWPKKE